MKIVGLCVMIPGVILAAWGHVPFGLALLGVGVGLASYAVGLEDGREQEWYETTSPLRGMVEETCKWIGAECVRDSGQDPIGHVVPGCRAMVELLGEALDESRPPDRRRKKKVKSV